MKCDSIFKERSNVNAKYQRRNIPFVSKIPTTTSLNVSQIYKNNKTKQKQQLNF